MANQWAKRGVFILIIFSGFIFYFLFLHNRVTLKDLPYIGPRLGTVANETTGKEDTIYHTVPPFSFVDQNGDILSSDVFHGHIYVTDFFFARCQGVCPIMTRQMKRVQDAFKDDDDILILSHTVDPGHDTSEALKAYGEMYGAIPGKWFFVTGEKDSIYQLAERGYFLTAAPGVAGGEAFLHDQHFMLVDREGHLRGLYEGTDSMEVTRLIDEIRILKKSYGEGH